MLGILACINKNHVKKQQKKHNNTFDILVVLGQYGHRYKWSSGRYKGVITPESGAITRLKTAPWKHFSTELWGSTAKITCPN